MGGGQRPVDGGRRAAKPPPGESPLVVYADGHGYLTRRGRRGPSRNRGFAAVHTQESGGGYMLVSCGQRLDSGLGRRSKWRHEDDDYVVRDTQVDNRSLALGPHRRGHPAIKAKLRSFLEKVLK